jgi:uncharacterized protein YecE (DUF72 family)
MDRRDRGAQPARRLEEYARYPLFRTVGIDSAFYDPPSEEVLAAYARALPSGFPCVSKVWDRITARRLSGDRRWGNLAGMLNPDFLNADLFNPADITVARALLRPGRSLRPRAGAESRLAGRPAARDGGSAAAEGRGVHPRQQSGGGAPAATLAHLRSAG